jgi:hypothetical protein
VSLHHRKFFSYLPTAPFKLASSVTIPPAADAKRGAAEKQEVSRAASGGATAALAECICADGHDAGKGSGPAGMRMLNMATQVFVVVMMI